MTIDELDIRQYKEDDENQVVELWRIVFRDDPPWNEPRDVIRRKLEIQPELFLVAESRGHIAGTVVAGFDGVRGWIHHLSTRPENRRQGVATALLERAESLLTEMGCPKLNLQVRAGNSSARAFYENLGYQVEDRTSFGKRLGSWAAV